MRKVLAFAASTALSLGALSVASATGTGKAAKECPKPVHHQHHHHKHHAHHNNSHCEPVSCTACPSLHSGFFGGLKGGYAWVKGKLKQVDQDTDPANPRPAIRRIINGPLDTNLGADGGEIGLFLGYDHYFPNCWVLGLEGGAQWTNITGKASGTATISGVESFSDGSRLKSDRSYDISVRLGHKVYDCSLWYVKAGIQITHFKLHSFSNATNLVTSVSNGLKAHKSKYRPGFLTGFGVEIPVACHWSLGAEYNFTWYRRLSTSESATDGSGDFIKSSIRPYENQLIARLIWKQ